MELSPHKKYEYEQLELTLKGYGVFEAGMQYDEMLQVLGAVEQSMQAHRPDLWGSPKSLPKPTDLVNSTMIESSTDSSGQCSSSADSPENENNNRPPLGVESPNDGPIRLLVCAQVHHAHNWNPSVEEAVCTRIERSQNICSNLHEADQSESKHSHADETPNSAASVATDSGANWDDRGSSLYDESLPHTSTSCSSAQSRRMMVSTSSAAVTDMSLEEHSSAAQYESSSQGQDSSDMLDAPRGSRCVDSSNGHDADE